LTFTDTSTRSPTFKTHLDALHAFISKLTLVQVTKLLQSLIASGMFLSSAALAQVADIASTAEPANETGRLIVKYRQTDGAPGFITKSSGVFDRSKWRAKMGLIVSRKLAGNQELVGRYKAPLRSTGSYPLQSWRTRKALHASANEDVEFVSPEYIRQPAVFPNDPLFEGNFIQGSQSYLYEGVYSAHATDAWDITTGSESSVIAIIDTGILPMHPELAERSVPSLGFDFVSATNPGDFFNANDGDGRDSDPTDPGDHCPGRSNSSWHGTEIASVAGAQSNDSLGLAGIDWNARLLHVRALGRCGGTDADIIDAVRWSAGIEVPGIPQNPTPARVVNLSIGGPTECTRAWQDVINQLNTINVSVVVAAGNEAANALRSSPANCADVIAVGASDTSGDLDTFFSNYGLKVTVAAPGRNIQLATNEGLTSFDESGNSYTAESGTSLSAAIISGTVSLMHSLDTSLSSADARAALQSSATPFAPTDDCSNYYCGAGILNMASALSMVRDKTYDPNRDQERDIIQSFSTRLLLNQEIESTLSNYRDIRYYQLDTPTDGLLTISSASEDNLFGYLLDENYSVLAIDDDSAGNRQFRVASGVKAGQYYLAVERSRNRTTDGESVFTLIADVIVDQPNPFIFADIENAPRNSTITSNTVEISGLNDAVLMTVGGGFYSLNGADLTATQALVSNGDTVSVAVTTPGSIQATATAELSVGAFTTTFAVTTSDVTDSVDRTITSASGGCSISSQGDDSSLPLLLSLALILVGFRSRQSFLPDSIRRQPAY